MSDETVLRLGQALLDRGLGNVSITEELADCDFSLICQLAQDLAVYFSDRMDQRLVIVAAPLEVTENLVTCAPDIHEYKLESGNVITVYLHCEQNFLIEADEEYRKSLSLSPDLKAVFRSWRDQESALLGWEFNNYIFAWRIRDSHQSGKQVEGGQRHSG